MKSPTVEQMVSLNSSNYPYLIITSDGKDYHIKNDAAIRKFGEKEVKKISFATPCFQTKIQIVMKLEV